MAGQKDLETSQSPSLDAEKSGRDVEVPRHGSIDNPEGLNYTRDTNRESDFLTRNGLNLKSFERRKLSLLDRVVST